MVTSIFLCLANLITYGFEEMNNQQRYRLTFTASSNDAMTICFLEDFSGQLFWVMSYIAIVSSRFRYRHCFFKISIWTFFSGTNINHSCSFHKLNNAKLSKNITYIRTHLQTEEKDSNWANLCRISSIERDMSWWLDVKLGDNARNLGSHYRRSRPHPSQRPYHYH